MTDDIVAGRIPHVFVRYYEEPPEKKSLGQCRSHGQDHAAVRLYGEHAYVNRMPEDPRGEEIKRKL